LSVDLNEPKDSSKTNKAVQNGRTPKSLTLEIHHGGWFTSTPSRSYIGEHVSSVNVVDIDEFCLHDLKDMVVKLGYGVEDLMYCHFLIPSLGLAYVLHSLNVDADVLEISKYVKDYKIILVYVEHGSSIFVTPKKGVSIAVNNHLRKGHIEIDSSPDVNKTLTPMCHRNLTKEWEQVSSKSLSIGEVMKNLSKKQPSSSVEAPIVVECVEDPFEELDDLLGEYAHIGKQITRNEITGNEITRNESTGNEITGKQMVVHVGNSSTVDDVLELGMLFETEGVGPVGKFKEVEVDADNESEEESDTEGDYTMDSDSEDLDYDPKHDDVFDDDEHIVEEVHVNMNNFRFTVDPKHDTSIGGVDVQDDDLDVIDNWQLVDGRDQPIITCLEYIREYLMKRNVVVQKVIAKTVGPLTPSVTKIFDAITRTFRRVYVCLGALKQGFRACGREILGLDGCFMSGPWPGQILTAVGVDANNGIYPVAYAIVEAESKASWCWFLNLLGEDLGIEANFNYTFIFDRQKGLIQAIASVFPSAEHRYCVRHIHENMKSQFKGGVYKEMLWNAAKATSEGEFKKKMGELKSFNSDAYDWLMKIPLEQWSRAHFSGRAKCDLLINNICEVFNRQLVDGRDQPIITCLEYIIEYLMKRIVVVQKVIAKTVGPLTPSVTKMFDAIKKRLLSTMTWELTEIPCKHVVAAIYNMSENSVGVGIPEQWVHAAYRLETWAHVYSFKVNPCNERDMWPVVESRIVIIPPLYKSPVGRPPKKRKKSNDEIASQSASSGKLSRKGKSVSCGKCGNVGHNRKGCRGQGGGSSQAGARKVSSQAAGATNVSGQAVGARKISSQPSAAQSTTNQGLRQGFQGPIAGPAFGSQRKTKKLVDL
ncbi:mutator type transposase, partial [Tanacetum coccineum]